MNAWKCYNCEIVHGVNGGRNFEAEFPVCPVCKADGRTHRGRNAVVARVVLHFDPPTECYGFGHNVLACDPTVQILGNKNSLRATGDHREVTCEACKATKVFKAAAEGGADLSNRIFAVPVNQPPDDDVPVAEPVIVSMPVPKPDANVAETTAKALEATLANPPVAAEPVYAEANPGDEELPPGFSFPDPPKPQPPADKPAKSKK